MSESVVLNLILLCVTEIFGDFQLKFFARGNELSNLGGGLLGYGGVIFFLIRCFKQANVLWVNGMWDGISAILESIAAYVILGERFNTWHQYAGLAVIVLGIFLLRMGHAPK